MNQYLAWYILCGIPILGFLHTHFSGDVGAEDYKEALTNFGLILFSIVCYPIALVIVIHGLWESTYGNSGGNK